MKLISKTWKDNFVKEFDKNMNSNTHIMTWQPPG
jgi:hypothetical protein